MNKIIYILSIATAIIIAGFCTYVAEPALRYAEGWCTFYYDQQYLDTVNTETAIRAFLLQPFACTSNAIIAMVLLTCIIMCIVALLLKASHIRNVWAVSLSSLAASVLACVFIEGWMAQMPVSSMFLPNAAAKSNLQFIEGSNMVRQQQWDEIIDFFNQSRPVNNQIHQNILNMALAEKGELGNKLLDEPCTDIRAIYVNDIPNYLIAAHLSDVYYSMGHIAQSQRYAFEANEKLDNFSPRLLQRLVQTNIIYGQYAVAEKYIAWLRHTLYYKDWANKAHECIACLEKEAKSEDAFVAEMSMKRRCLFDDDRFSGLKGLDDDLLQVARNTRGTSQCRTTLHYLGSLYILANYREQFGDMIEEFGGSPDLPKPLPNYFDSYYNHIKTQN